MIWWDVFSLLYGLVATPLLASVDAMAAAMSNYIAPVLRAGLIVFVIVSLLMKAFYPNGNPLSDLTKTLLMGSIAIYMVASVANYGPWARDLLLLGIPREVGQALAGSLGGRPLTGSSFGEIWGKGFTAGLAVLRNLPSAFTSPGAAFTLGGAVLVYWVVVTVATVLAFGVWLKAFVFLALLVGIGPLFAGLWVFPLTRHLATGWFSVTMSAVVLQILVVALVSLLVASVTQLLAQLAAAGPAGRGNEIVQLGTLFSGAILYSICGWLSYLLPGIASRITGGFAGYARSASMRLDPGMMSRFGMPSFGSRQEAAAAAPSYGVTMAPVQQVGGHQPAVASRGAGRLGGPPGRSLSN